MQADDKVNVGKQRCNRFGFDEAVRQHGIDVGLNSVACAGQAFFGAANDRGLVAHHCASLRDARSHLSGADDGDVSERFHGSSYKRRRRGVPIGLDQYAHSPACRGRCVPCGMTFCCTRQANTLQPVSIIGRFDLRHLRHGCLKLSFTASLGA